jgi:hypothetical protein
VADWLRLTPDASESRPCDSILCVWMEPIGCALGDLGMWSTIAHLRRSIRVSEETNRSQGHALKEVRRLAVGTPRHANCPSGRLVLQPAEPHWRIPGSQALGEGSPGRSAPKQKQARFTRAIRRPEPSEGNGRALLQAEA